MFPLVALCALVTSSLVALVCTLVSVTCRDLRPCEALWAVNAGYSVPSCPAMPCSGQDRAQTEQLLVHALVHGPLGLSELCTNLCCTNVCTNPSRT